MKKIVKALLCLVLAATMLLPCVSGAAKYTDEADALYDLGLFKGTGTGYELDRQPTRAEAAVMLVRFLGKEKTALSLSWTAPFKDVPDWAKPYVQYLYSNGLTQGTSGTTYSPNDKCTAQMYSAFMLRSLGYKDGVKPDSVKKTIEARADVSKLTSVSYVKMNLHSTSYNDVPVESSIVDIWPSNDPDYECGFLFETTANYKKLYNAITSSSDGETLSSWVELKLASTKDVYIFNGKPTDADFGKKVYVNLYEGFGAYLGISEYKANPSYNCFVMLPGLWRSEDDVSLEEGYYTFIVYTDDGAVGFTEYIVPNELEEQFGKTYSYDGPSKKDVLTAGSVDGEATDYGYDYFYSDTIDFAKSKKLISSSDTEGTFLRDNMVKISYRALKLPTADGKYTRLGDKLVAEGVITKEKAEKVYSGEYLGNSTTYGNFLGNYADYDAANAWIKEYITDTENPPVKFTYNGKSSDSLKWTKSVGEQKTVTDYPDSDNPVQRKYREITYTCSAESLKLVLTLTTYDNYPVVEYSSYLTNTSKNNSGEIKNVLATDSLIKNDDAGEITVHYNKGSQCANDDFKPFAKTLSSSLSLQCGSDGRATNDYLPNFNFSYENGGGVIAVINWQSNWKMNAEKENEGITFTAGQKNTDFVLLGSEDYKVPGIVLMFYKNGDWQQGQNVWRRWIIEHNLMRYTGRRDYDNNVYICSNSYDSSSDITALNNNTSVELADGLNLTFHIDAGWYTPEIYNNWWPTGNWTPKGTYSVSTFKKISSVCKQNGYGFSLWFEPERIFSGTDEANALGDNVIYLDGNGNYKKYSSTTSSDMGIINYGTQEAEDYVVNLIDTAVKTYGLTNYRQDYNTSCSEYFNAYDAYEAKKYGVARTGMTESKYCEGYINAWTRIAALNPGLTFDCCASGGRRADLESLRFSYMHTKSDNWINVNSQQCQNFSLYSWYIFTGTAFGDVSSKYDMRTRLTLSIGIDVALNKQVARALKEWRENQKYLYNDYYALGSYSLSDSKTIAMQFNDYENEEGMMIVYLRAGGSYTFVAQGLNENATYRVYDKDGVTAEKTMTGKELMTTGFTVERKKQSAVIVLYEAN